MTRHGLQAAAAEAKGADAKPLRERAARVAERHAALLQQHADADTAPAQQQAGQHHAPVLATDAAAAAEQDAHQQHAPLTGADQVQAAEAAGQAVAAQQAPSGQEAAQPNAPPVGTGQMQGPDAELQAAAIQQASSVQQAAESERQASPPLPALKGASEPQVMHIDAPAPDSVPQPDACASAAAGRQPDSVSAADCLGSADGLCQPTTATAPAAADVAAQKPAGGRRKSVASRRSGASAAAAASLSAADLQPGDLIWAQVWDECVYVADKLLR